MRVVSAELAAAIVATERTLRATGSVDWDGDGHDTSTAPPRVLRDSFDREPVVSGWGGAWATSGGSASDHSVGAGVAVQSHGSVNVRRIALLDAGAADVSYTVDVQLAITSAAGAPVTQWAAARVTDSSNCYFARLDVDTAGAVSLALYKLVAGAQTTLAAAVQLAAAHVAGDWWRIGIQTAGTALRAKAWLPSSQPEPAWQVTAVDGSLTTGTLIGPMSRLNSGNSNTLPVPVTWDNLRVVTGNIDDISGQLGDLTITRALTGQLPDEVLVVEGISAATASSNLVKGLVGDERLAAVQFWSRLNPDSPLWGKPRANRDAKLAIELLTSAGWQSVPLLTKGVLRSLPVSVKDRRAQLQLLDARDRFRTPIDLPAVVADGPYNGSTLPLKPGLEAAWPISYALWKCQLPLSPPPRAGCRLWAPMHGSATPFISRQYVAPTYAYTRPDTSAPNNPKRVRFSGDAPFFMALTHSANYPTPAPQTLMEGFLADTGSAMWDSAGRSSGRIEVWCKIPAAPSTATIAFYMDLWAEGAGTGGNSDPNIEFRVLRDGTSRLRLTAGGSILRTITGPTYTHDGAWHLFGVHWDDVAGSATFRRDSTSDVVAYTPVSSPDLPVSLAVRYLADIRVPAAELQVTTGLTAGTAWQPLTWTPGVVVDRPQNRRLAGIYPEGPQQAWALFQAVYGAERGLVWVSVDGVLQLWTAARLNMPDALNVVRTVTSSRDLLSLGYRDDRSMIRNIIRCGYTTVALTASTELWKLGSLVRLDPGQTWTVSVQLTAPIVSAPTLVGTGSTSATGGGGSQWGVSDISPVRGRVTVTSPTSATITVTNLAGVTVFLSTFDGEPSLSLTGSSVVKVDGPPVEVRDQASIAAYGDSPLDVPANPWAQTKGWALGTVWGLLGLLREEQIVYVDIEIPGDPRLDPLDRLRVQDRHGLMLDTPITLLQRSDSISGGRYNSGLIARPSRNQWLLGGPGVGTALGSTILGGTP
ncbi:hypothetical protein ACQEVZ_20315 [Dactylosporangium sp. CA-152071]|uniref:hypothetical protein n=1 Tax=Dactylosporangium sp. CA-152071 TaxID=3239933 RepID=UPI003D94C5C3